MRILITQRIDVIKDRSELRDSLDRSWYLTMSNMLQTTVYIHPMPNRQSDVNQAFDCLKPSLLVLSGGSDIGVFPERDATEMALISRAITEDVPILAVCRGMQIIQQFLGGHLSQVIDHVANDHMISAVHKNVGPSKLQVNSFHAWGIFADELAHGLKPLYQHADDSIEAARHSELPWLCMMWHPERAGDGMETANNWAGHMIRELL